VVCCALPAAMELMNWKPFKELFKSKTTPRAANPRNFFTIED